MEEELVDQESKNRRTWDQSRQVGDSVGDCLVTPSNYSTASHSRILSLHLQNASVFACPHPLQGYILLYPLLFLIGLILFTGLHASARRNALTKMTMPAMSPTMMEGGISAWKKAEGETFSTGDVLLEIVCVLASRRAPCQLLTTYHHRKPTRRLLTWKHKRTASLPRLSYVTALLAPAIPSSRVHVIGPGRIKECCCG